MSKRNGRRVSARLGLIVVAWLALTFPASAQVLGNLSTITTRDVPSAPTPWASTILCGTTVWYSRSYTVTRTVSTTFTVVNYPGTLSRIFNLGGTAIGTTGPVVATTTLTATQSMLGSSIFPPGAGLPPPTRTTSSDPPPTNDPAYAFFNAGSQIDIPQFSPTDTYATDLGLLGTEYGQAANTLGQVVSDLTAADNPMGLRTIFLTDFSAIQSDMSLVGSALDSGMPSSGTPFSSLAQDLTTFSSDLNLLPGGSNYVMASADLVPAINALDDAASLAQSGLVCTPTNPAQVDFLQDLQIVSQHYQQFGSQLAVPEPSPFVPLAMGALGMVGCVWRRRKKAA